MSTSNGPGGIGLPNGLFYLSSSELMGLPSSSNEEAGEGASVYAISGRALALFLTNFLYIDEGGGSDPMGMSAGKSLLTQLERMEAPSLNGALKRLDPQHRKFIKNKLGSLYEELISISKYQEPRLLQNGLMQWGKRAFKKDKISLAGMVFQTLAESPDFFGMAIEPSLRGGALHQWNIIQGKGNSGERAQYYLHHAPKEILHPGTIVGIGLGGWAFSRFRLGALTRLVSRPGSFWTRGFASRALASSAAFPAEVLAFWGATRVYDHWAHPERLSSDPVQIFKELGGVGLILGFLKLGGKFNRSLFDKVHGFDPLTQKIARLAPLARFSRPLLNQLGMYGGMVGGHSVAGALGLASPIPSDHFTERSLVLLLQFNALGKAAEWALGPKFAARQRAIELKTREIVNRNRPNFPQVTSLWNHLRVKGPPWVPRGRTAEGWDIPIPEKPELEIRPLDGTSLSEGKGDGGKSQPPPTLVKPSELVKKVDPATLGRLDPLVDVFLARDVDLAKKVRVGVELFEYRDAIKEIIGRKLRERWDSENDISKPLTERELADLEAGFDKEIKSYIKKICSYHFEALTDRMYAWEGKGDWILKQGIPDEIARSDNGDLPYLEDLYDSFRKKYWEFQPEYKRAERILGDYLSSDFAEGRYIELLKEFRPKLEAFEDFVASHPRLGKILEGYKQDFIPRHFDTWDPESMDSILGVAKPLLEPLRESLRYDPNLTTGEWVPFARVLKKLNSGLLSGEYLKIWAPIERYIHAQQKIILWMTPQEIHRLGDEFERLDRGASQTRKSAVREIRKTLHALMKARMKADPGPLIQEYLDATMQLRALLKKYRPRTRKPPVVSWPEVKRHLNRLQAKEEISSEIVRRLLGWFAAKGDRVKNDVLYKNRVDNVMGMVEFLFNDSINSGNRAKILGLLGEAISRGDQQMLEQIFIRFYYYHHGAAVGEGKPKNLLRNLLEAADFYKSHPDFSGPYIEIVERLRRAPKSRLAQSVLSIKLAVDDFLIQGKKITYSSRGGRGQGVLFIHGSEGVKEVLGVTSVVDPLESRIHLEEWLLKEEETVSSSHPPHTDGQSIKGTLRIYLPRIKPGVDKILIPIWARDFLDKSNTLDEIHIIMPEKGISVREPFRADSFKVEVVDRINSFSSKGIIRELRQIIESWPGDIKAWLELIRQTRSLREGEGMTEEVWDLLKDAAAKFPKHPTIRAEMAKGLQERFQEMWRSGENNLIVGEKSKVPDYLNVENGLPKWGSKEHFERVSEFWQAALGVAPSAIRLENLFNLDRVGFQVRSLEFDYKNGTLKLSGEIEPIPNKTANYKEVDKLLWDSEHTGLYEGSEGYFAMSFQKDWMQNRLILDYGQLKLPISMRGSGVGTYLFSEVLRLAREMKVDELTSGEMYYPEAVWGWQFKDYQSRFQAHMDFQEFAKSILKEQGMVMEGDLPPIESPQDLAYAHIDLENEGLKFTPWDKPGPGGEKPTFLDPRLKIGRRFLVDRKNGMWLNGTFDPRPDSHSSKIFSEYYAKRFGIELLPGGPKEAH